VRLERIGGRGGVALSSVRSARALEVYGSGGDRSGGEGGGERFSNRQDAILYFRWCGVNVNFGSNYGRCET